MDYVGPVIGAALFVLLMSLVPEPTRRTFNAVLVGGASGVYLSGGFGLWELAYPAPGHTGSVSRAALVPLHRSRMADARSLRPAASPMGQPDLAVHADFVVGVCHLRHPHRGLVLGRYTLPGQQPCRIGNAVEPGTRPDTHRPIQTWYGLLMGDGAGTADRQAPRWIAHADHSRVIRRLDTSARPPVGSLCGSPRHTGVQGEDASRPQLIRTPCPDARSA